VHIGLNVRQIETDKVVEILKRLLQVKFLWKTYGTLRVTLVMFCEKSKIGEDVFNLKISLEKEGIDAYHMDASTSFSWKKMDFSPYTPLDDQKSKKQNEIWARCFPIKCIKKI